MHDYVNGKTDAYTSPVLTVALLKMNWSYTSWGAFTKEPCFITERHGQQVARAKVKAGVIDPNDWLMTKLKQLSLVGCLETGPYGREHQKAVARDMMRAFINRTIVLN